MKPDPRDDQAALESTDAIEAFNRKMSAQSRPYRLVQRPPAGPVGANAASFELRSEHGDTFEVCCHLSDLAPADAAAAAEAFVRECDAGTDTGSTSTGGEAGSPGHA